MKLINKFHKEEIEQIKGNIKYLNELLDDIQDSIIEFEIKKQILHELNLLKTRIFDI